MRASACWCIVHGTLYKSYRIAHVAYRLKEKTIYDILNTLHKFMLRTIFHIDLDAFFASVEQRDNPSLKGRPVIIGADPKGGRGRGVVSTCSYEARAFGVHSAMPISQAYRLCPSGVYLLPNMEKYEKAAADVFEIFEQFSPDMEPVSIDEAFIDMTGSCHLFGSPKEAGQKLKARVKEKTGLTASVGIAPNMMTAKIASDHGKPDGLLEITQEGLLDFLHPLKISKLWGVGPKTQQALENMGMFTIGDIARFPQQKLIEAFGENGRHLFALANGIDERRVEMGDDVKSVSNEETFEEDTEDQRLIFDTLLALSEKVSQRLRDQELKGRSLTLKVRLTGFKTYTHAARFDERTNHADKIFKKAKVLFIDHFVSAGTVRLIGVRGSDFDAGYVRERLFADEENERKESVHRAVDSIRDKFGKEAIRRAGG